MSHKETMIPSLPEGMKPREVLKFYDTISGNLTDQGTIHVHWWTHRQNPSVCWICDMITLISKVLVLAFEINTKSSVDMMTNVSLDAVSDSEIEFPNKDDENYNEPEYDIIDSDSVEETEA